MSHALLSRAYNYATHVHRGQVRKYTGLPYMTHCAAVAKLLAQYDVPAEWIAAALLHDTVEDGVNPAAIKEYIHRNFGPAVYRLVLEVTDISTLEDGPRAVRKQIDADHLAKASTGGMSIKLADMIDNTRDIVEHDPRFAKICLPEFKALLPRLSGGDARLFNTASQVILSGDFKVARSLVT